MIEEAEFQKHEDDSGQNQSGSSMCYGKYNQQLSPLSTTEQSDKSKQVKKEQEEIDDSNDEILSKRIAKKRAKKVSKFIQLKLKQKQQLNYNPNLCFYEEIVVPTNLVYIFGDEVIELNYNLNPFEDNPIDINEMARFRRVKIVESRNDVSSFEINYELGSKQQNYFQFVVDKFLSSNQRELHEFGNSLKQYQNLSLCSYKDMLRHQVVMTDQLSCKAMIEKQNIFIAKSYEWIKANTTEYDFYTYSFSKLNQESLSFQNNKMGISQSLIALLGGDFNTISQTALRKGGLHFLNSRSRFLQIHDKVTYSNFFKCTNRELDFELITFDQIIIPCKVSIQYFQHPLCDDPHCEYKKKYKIDEIYWMNFYSTCKLIKYQISTNMILQIMETRKKVSQENKILYDQYFDDFVYTTESEIFLEKYYQREKSQIQKGSKYPCGFVDL